MMFMVRLFWLAPPVRLRPVPTRGVTQDNPLFTRHGIPWNPVLTHPNIAWFSGPMDYGIIYHARFRDSLCVKVIEEREKTGQNCVVRKIIELFSKWYSKQKSWRSRAFCAFELPIYIWNAVGVFWNLHNVIVTL